MIKRTFFLVALLVNSVPVFSAQEEFSQKLQSVLVDTGGVFGGCIAQLTTQNITLPGCSTIPSYVTFDCEGLSGETTRAGANNALSTAQMGLALDVPVFMIVDDSVVINGVCLARRVAVTSTAQ